MIINILKFNCIYSDIINYNLYPYDIIDSYNIDSIL